MKVALIFGKGIDGCGVTKCGIEMEKYFLNNNIECKVFAFDKKFNRSSAHKFQNLSLFKNINSMLIKEINLFDIVIFHSYPSAKVDNKLLFDFKKMVESIQSTKVGFMHELNKTNIDKIPFILSLMNSMDLVYNFSEKSWFSQTLSNLLPSKQIGKRIKSLKMIMDFSEFDKIDRMNNRDFNIRYIGRWTTMKDPHRLLKLQKLYSKLDKKPDIEIFGIERSHGAIADLINQSNSINLTRIPKNNKLNDIYYTKSCNNPDKLINEYLNLNLRFNKEKVPIFGAYNYDTLLKLMSNTQFGASFYALRPDNIEGYGNRMEYTQIEIIACGAIPLFDKQWGENNYTKNGIRFIDLENFAIFIDRNNLEDGIKQINSLQNDKKLQKEYRKNAYKIIKSEYDVNINMKIMFDDMKNIVKDNHKFGSDKELILSIFNSEELANDIISNIQNEDEIPVIGFREIVNGIYAIDKNGKQEELKKYQKYSSIDISNLF